MGSTQVGETAVVAMHRHLQNSKIDKAIRQMLNERHASIAMADFAPLKLLSIGMVGNLPSL